VNWLRRALSAGALWRHPDFLKLWGGQSLSELGSQVTMLALPSAAIILLRAGPVQLGILAALEFLPFLLVGLGAGVLVDRLPRRMVMVVADTGRCLSLGSIPAAFAFHALSLTQLYAVAFLTGVGTVFFDVAYQSYLPGLVSPANLVEGNSKLAVTESAAGLAGPALGGVLIQAIGAARAIAVDAASYLASIGSLLLIQASTPLVAPQGHRRFHTQLWEGIRFVFRAPVLRNIMACGATHNLGTMMVRALLLLFAYRQLRLSPATVGLIFAAGSLTSLLGATVAGMVTRLLGVGPTLALAQILTGLAYLLIPAAAFAAPVVLLTASQLLLGLLRSVFNVVQVSLRQAVTPDALRGRMTATIRTVIWGIYPVGALLGGALGARVGLTPTLTLGALLSLLATGWLLTRPVVTVRSHPGQPAIHPA
jgi:MFS family permease